MMCDVGLRLANDVLVYRRRDHCAAVARERHEIDGAEVENIIERTILDFERPVHIAFAKI